MANKKSAVEHSNEFSFEYSYNHPLLYRVLNIQFPTSHDFRLLIRLSVALILSLHPSPLVSGLREGVGSSEKWQ